MLAWYLIIGYLFFIGFTINNLAEGVSYARKPPLEKAITAAFYLIICFVLWPFIVVWAIFDEIFKRR